ncbi:hypothetical protein [Polaribacter atrinae]|uniref:hypothetical protein n=1 Tax=Polaribacter atrinae TaxID=1333662 RepID=UPI0030F93B07
MRKILLSLLLFCTIQTLLSQEKLGQPFFTGSANLTFAVNEHYTLDPDDGETFLIPSAIFFRMGFGYEIKKRVAISVNGGFDYHWNYAVSAFPTYVSLKYNITEDEGDNFFTEVSYGKMWRPSSNYPNGNYYRIGLGTQVAGAERWNTIVRLDFHRKGIIGFENNRLDSVSLGIGFSFF